MIGLFPAAISNGIGAQTQKPLAIVVIGGSIMLAVVARMVQPPLLVMAHRWFDRRTPPPGPEGSEAPELPGHELAGA
jgi:Cu/Ag efflux pump CusA